MRMGSNWTIERSPPIYISSYMLTQNNRKLQNQEKLETRQAIQANIIIERYFEFILVACANFSLFGRSCRCNSPIATQTRLLLGWVNNTALQMKRIKLPKQIEADLLKKSRHNCNICHDIIADVIIHHIDGDTSNYSNNNLIVLCEKCYGVVERKGHGEFRIKS